MKSALELHKDILQGLQTVDAFSQDMFLPEELDLHLNRMQDSFVNELLDEGFADRQLRLDYVQDLIVKNKPMPSFISPTAFYYESGAIISFLPGGYKHLLNTRTATRRKIDCTDIGEIETEEKILYFNFLKLTTDTTIAPFYSKVDLIKINEDQSEEVIATVNTPILEASDTYLIVRTLLYQANTTDIEVYWEKYTDTERQGIIKKNTIIIVDDNPTPYKIVVYKEDSTEENTIIGVVEQQIVEVYTEEALDALTSPEWTATSLLANKDLYERKQNIYFYPKITNPHTLISDGILFNYYGKDFIMEKVLIDYIREPQPISLEADQGCELSISGANIIVNRTIEYLKLAIENPNYREVIQHNTLRDQK